MGYPRRLCDIRRMDVVEAFKTQFAKLTATVRHRGSSTDDAEDVVQEAFVRLLHYIEKGKEVKEIDAFLARVVRNASIDRSRRERKHLREGQSAEELMRSDPDANPVQDAADMEYLRFTACVLDKVVGQRARRVFQLCCFDDMTHAEIAEKLNVSVATVRRDYARAIRVLSMREPRYLDPSRSL